MIKYVLIISMFLSSCASVEKFLNDFNKEGPKRLEVIYDSIASSDQLGNFVCIEIIDDKMMHLEKELYKSKLIDIFKANGYEITDFDKCSHVVRVVIGAETKKYTTMVPIFNYTPAKSYTAHSYGAYGTQTTTVSENGSGQLNVVGQAEQVNYINTNAAFLFAIDKKKAIALSKIKGETVDKASIWQIKLFAVSQSDDFRYVMPIMIKALNGKLGSVKTEKVNIEVYEDMPQKTN